MSQADQIPAIRLRAIQVTGPDAIAFMQSQLTVDVESISESRLYPAAWCSPDGRVDAAMLISVKDGSVDLVLPEALVATTMKRARMFSIGRKIVLDENLDVRPGGPKVIGEQRELPLALDPDRSLLLGAGNTAVENGSKPLSDQWLRADIQCRMPWILPETARRYLPQMLGMESLGGLSYRKGCFPGQEVIARVHYRGRVARRIARFRLRAASPPAPGREFEHAGKPAQVLYSVPESGEPGALTGLAVVAAEAEDNAKIHIGSAAGQLF